MQAEPNNQKAAGTGTVETAMLSEGQLHVSQSYIRCLGEFKAFKDRGCICHC